MPRRTSFPTLARSIDPARAEAYASRLAGALSPGSEAHSVALALATAYPALAHAIEATPAIPRAIAAAGLHAERSRAELLAALWSRIPDRTDVDAVRRELRRGAQHERMRIALREVAPASLGGADVDVTGREWSALGEATIEVALEEAMGAITRRYGAPLTESGAPSRFTVLGMGKLGGEELNPGSDVDLIFLYDSDDAAAGASISLHDFWTRVAKRLVATLEDVTEDGFVWRVDLRLRPEGRSGPLVNSLAASERYYEAFGRLWERAALLRARPVAGDRVFGDEALAALSPFVWRRRVDPEIAAEMGRLLLRARAEMRGDPALDLKLGPGGIREAEFFVQSLMLIWGGREPRVRARGTLDGLRRLRAAGFVTDRESRLLAGGYLALRRAEHATQIATGQQTHALPDAPADARRLARSLGFADEVELRAELDRHRAAITRLFRGIIPGGAPSPSRWTEALSALDRGELEAFIEAFLRAAGAPSWGAADDARDTARDVFELSRHPDAPLGARSREAFPSLAETLLSAVIDAADPALAARYLRTFFARVRQASVYERLLGDDLRAVRRLVEALGASAFIGDALIGNPELGDSALFARRAPSPDEARQEIEEATRAAKARAASHAPGGAKASPALGAEDLEDAIVGALRWAKARVTIEVGLSDLESEIGPREAGATLSALADASLEEATRLALGTKEGEPPRGLAVIAMGTLGGREIGYGSDLDVIFLFDPSATPAGASTEAYFARCARRVIRVVSMPHPGGPGYELDTRLRPSGSQGLLVTSLASFARYHGVPLGKADGSSADAPSSSSRGAHAAPWERVALVRARFAAGDAALGASVIRVARATCYGGDDEPDEARRLQMPPIARELDRLRRRMERELSGERGGRFDPKLGRGGLADIELVVQLLQMAHRDAPGVRTTETQAAIEALHAAGRLKAPEADALREGHAFLRKLQWRLRIVHASSAQLIEERAPGLSKLARRMGIRDRPGALAAAELVARYKAVTERVRDAYEAIIADLVGSEAAER